MKYKILIIKIRNRLHRQVLNEFSQIANIEDETTKKG